eukprot:4624456-Amphidinium_carterae.1
MQSARVTFCKKAGLPLHKMVSCHESKINRIQKFLATCDVAISLANLAPMLFCCDSVCVATVVGVSSLEFIANQCLLLLAQFRVEEKPKGDEPNSGIIPMEMISQEVPFCVPFDHRIVKRVQVCITSARSMEQK